ncbi:MAG: right-handed parallel beta-helix repeat-containing protein [Polyangia bacterium]
MSKELLTIGGNRTLCRQALVLSIAVAFAACASSSTAHSGAQAGGGSGGGASASSGGIAGGVDAGVAGQGGSAAGAGGSTTSPDTGPHLWGGVAFPWKIFDGSVPDVPYATGSGKTWFCDPVLGNDSYDGTSFTFQSGRKGPRKSLSALLAGGSVKAGDTVLLGGGIYREYPDFGNVSGTASSQITIGSYGRGTGAPILDGGLKPSVWTKYSAQGQTTVWQTSMAGFSEINASQPVLGIYVNNGTTESALREVPHGQLADYGDGLPPNQTQTGITDGSNKWYFDTRANVLYADFGGTLGSADPKAADISVLFNTHNKSTAQILVNIYNGTSYLSFVGLTIRASSWDGVYAEAANGIVFDHCDVKFNGGGGIALESGSGTSVTYSRLWMNVLDNWPRFNNGNVTGGWPGALSWFASSNALSQGNVVYQNGGEGMIFYGTVKGHTPTTSVNNAERNNIIYDNWSVNMYVDNTQNLRSEANFVFQHPRDASQTFDNLLSISDGYNSDWGRRMFPVNLSLADEGGSSDDNNAYLSNITVINNIFAGGQRGFLDYDDETATQHHGLKNSVIANNTFILGSALMPGNQGYGWSHLLWGGPADASVNSLVENNLFLITANSGDNFVAAMEAGAGPGITCDYNLYSGTAQFLSVDTEQDFATWKTAHKGWDQNSAVADALLVDSAQFNQTAAQNPVYDWSKAVPQAGSPARGSGTDLSNLVDSDFSGVTRASGSFDVGACL